jgi:hypothetical protein
VTLAEFYAARLDEDEAVAAMADGRPEFDGTGIVIQRNQGGNRSVVMPSHVATHIARHDPARVLREVEAGRKLLRLYQEAAEVAEPVVVEVIGGIICDRAAVYNDHEDYVR